MNHADDENRGGALRVIPLSPPGIAANLFGAGCEAPQRTILIRSEANPGAVFLLGYSGDPVEADARIRKFLHDIGDQFLDIMEELGGS